jgi:transcriptional regulator with XRE-family HTH domain
MATQRRPAGVRLRHLYLEEWLAHLGVTDIELAKRIGAARETIWRYQAGKRQPAPARQAEIAKALGIKPAQLWEMPPGGNRRPSLDAIIEGASDEVYGMAVDIVRRITGRQ